MLKSKLFVSILFFLSVALFPFYFFSSGLPQVSHYFFVAFLIFGFIYINKVNEGRFYNLPLQWSLLVIVIVIVSSFWSIWLQDFTLAYNLLFWVFNYLVCFIFYSLLRIEYNFFIKVLFYSVICAVMISTFGVLMSEGSVRSSGYFNNPNQLAYFSLLALVIIFLVKDFKINGIYLYLFVLFGILGVLLSASISAVLSLFFIFAGYAYSNLTLKKLGKMIFLITVLSSGVLIIGGESLQDSFKTRMDRFDNKVDSVKSERNYDRITDNLEYVIFGAAEGAYYRFGDYDTHEIHSSFGNILFSYGVMAFTLFISLLVKVYRTLSFPQFLTMLAPLLYSVTHMGLRSTYFWILIVLCLSFKSKEN